MRSKPWKRGKGNKQLEDSKRRRRVHNFTVDDVFTAFHLQISLCYASVDSFFLAIYISEQEKLSAVELFIIQMNQFLSALRCCFIFFLLFVLFRGKAGSNFYGIFSCNNEVDSGRKRSTNIRKNTESLYVA